MRVFSNPVGAGSLWFDNLVTADGVPVAYDPQARAFLPMPPFCANREVIGCNWIAPKQGEFCRACAMTALAPDPSISDAMPNWAQTEAAKRWVIDNLGRSPGRPWCATRVSYAGRRGNAGAHGPCGRCGYHQCRRS